ncbi:MAG: AbrB/MazE/SpoVT family DNA-binding domain-containing protein [Polaromonas sp.]|nr:MAG: AbrB/MazE/SpoVT family DNA-binding domain-containing protein [Polaromonas sp.]
MPTATLSSKFQISIPKEIRDSMGFKPGQKLAFLCIGKSVSLMAQPRLEDLFGMGKGGDPSNYRDRDTRREDILPKTAARLEPVVSPVSAAPASQATRRKPAPHNPPKAVRRKAAA